jgi:hypothetical protein
LSTKHCSRSSRHTGLWPFASTTISSSAMCGIPQAAILDVLDEAVAGIWFTAGQWTVWFKAAGLPAWSSPQSRA